VTRREFERAVSETTGDDLAVIHQRGFELIDLSPPLANDELIGLYLDWDALYLQVADRCNG
jgi:hypothetical protein